MDQVIYQRLKNNGGFLSADFLFSIIIGITVSMMLFAICFTFSTIEIAQYVAFSVARAHAAGHEDESHQELMARNKFAQLMDKSKLGLLFKNGWFELKNLDIRGGPNNRNFNQDYPGMENRVPQTGVRLDFVAKIMNFRVAFLGKSSEDDSTFTSRVTGLLFREPTSSECREQLKNTNRYRAILDLDPRFKVLDSSGGGNPNYVPLEDNGC